MTEVFAWLSASVDDMSQPIGLFVQQQRVWDLFASHRMLLPHPVSVGRYTCMKQGRTARSKQDIPMASCLEMVTFTLAPDADKAAFVSAAPSVTEWAAKQPGFQYRTLVDRGNHGWIDMVWWASEAEAKAAGQKIGQDMMSSPFMQMIDPSSVKIDHHLVAHMGLAA